MELLSLKNNTLGDTSNLDGRLSMTTGLFYIAIFKEQLHLILILETSPFFIKYAILYIVAMTLLPGD